MPFQTNQKPVVAVAFAAGRGTRMQPITDTIPKPMIQIEGKTLLEYNLQRCSSFVDEYVIVVNWLKEVIVQAFDDDFAGKNIDYVLQDKYNGGTLDAFLIALEGFVNLEDYNFLVFNTDEIRGEKFYNEFAKNIQENPDKSLICGKHMEDKSLLSSFGVLETDSEGNLVKIHEKSQIYISSSINIGMYYFPGNALKAHLKDFLASYKQATKEKYLTDLIDYLVLKEGVKVISLDDEYRFYTSPEDLKEGK